METCKYCGNPFKKDRFYVKYCSFICRMRAAGNKLEYLNKGIKQCIICGKDFKQKTSNQITCSVECRNKRKLNISKSYYKPKIRCIIKFPEIIRKTVNVKAGINDRKILEMDRKRLQALKLSPDLNDLKPVRIDNRTTIYIKAFQDSELMRQNFITKYK